MPMFKPKQKTKNNINYKFLHSIIDNASDAIIPIDASGKIVFWNKAAENIFGYTSKEIIGKSLTKIMPTQLKPAEKTVGKVFETIALRKDGTQFPIEFSYSASEAHNRTFLTIIARDATRRKELERMIMDSEEKYRNLFENAKDVIAIIDLEGKIVGVNKACESYGIKREELLGRNAFDFVSQEYWQFVLKEIERLKRGKLVSNEIELTTPNGIVYAEYSGNPIKINNKIVGIQFIVRDITQRKKDERRIRESEKMFRELFETSLDGIVMIDMHGRIIDCNQAFANMLNYSKEELEKMTFKQLTPAAWHEMEEKIIKEQILRKGYSNEYEKEYIKKDGTVFPVALKAWLIKDEYGKPKAMWAIVRDITERKRMEQKLQIYTQNLEGLVEKKDKELMAAQAKLLQAERLAAIGELAGMVGHDLRNPLMGIAGAVYYLKTRAKGLSNMERKMLKIMEENIAYSNKIINDLQDYSSEIKLKPKRVDVKKLLNESLRSINIPQNVRVIDKTSKHTFIQADVDKMKRVFNNILQNAIDAMPNGGELTIESRKVNDMIEISFTDTGVGISKEILKNVGKPLFTTKAKGMGFGLAICHRIVESHNGKISIKSAIGKGTTVKVAIPIACKKASKEDNMLIETPEVISA